MKTTTDIAATLATLRTIHATAKRSGTMDKRAVGDLINSLGSNAVHVKVREAFAALGWDGEANGADVRVSLSQGMFRDSYYSDIAGDIRPSSDGGAPDGFYVLEVLPWHLQVQESRGARGAWHMIHSAVFFTKEEALADAARQGIEVDYVSHHENHVKGRAFPKVAKAA